MLSVFKLNQYWIFGRKRLGGVGHYPDGEQQRHRSIQDSADAEEAVND